jgi:hypothetical protein
MDEGFHTTGEILLITGVGGSLGAVIGETNLDEVLGGLFSADVGAPVLVTILLAWFIAAVLHLAIGSVSVAAITAAGIIAPILGSLNVAPVVVGLAIASGALCALQVNSNFFWMFKALLGLSTKGSLKTLTVATSVASWCRCRWSSSRRCRPELPATGQLNVSRSARVVDPRHFSRRRVRPVCSGDAVGTTELPRSSNGPLRLVRRRHSPTPARYIPVDEAYSPRPEATYSLVKTLEAHWSRKGEKCLT